MSTVDRLIDGINGEDPAGARFYMAQLRQNEVRYFLFLEVRMLCKKDKGKLAVDGR